jgi:hypothetical protein
MPDDTDKKTKGPVATPLRYTMREMFIDIPDDERMIPPGPGSLADKACMLDLAQQSGDGYFAPDKTSPIGPWGRGDFVHEMMKPPKERNKKVIKAFTTWRTRLTWKFNCIVNWVRRNLRIS